ncbi:MAG: hypothetical protein L0H31_05630 [Nocardioidaceae bacterium]|nr:hypothetical protein [Nocardioidaceae bacterium]
MTHAVLPAFEVASRQRPIAVVSTPVVEQHYGVGLAPLEAREPTPALAPFVAVEVGLGPVWAEASVQVSHVDGWAASAVLQDGRLRLEVGPEGARHVHRSRRHGRAGTPPDRLSLTLTGTQLTALSHEAGQWIARARVDLADLADGPEPRDPAWLGGLISGWSCAEPGAVTDWSAGPFGQLGLRDLRVASHADGSPYRMGEGDVLPAGEIGIGF